MFAWTSKIKSLKMDRAKRGINIYFKFFDNGQILSALEVKKSNRLPSYITPFSVFSVIASPIQPL